MSGIMNQYDWGGYYTYQCLHCGALALMIQGCPCLRKEKETLRKQEDEIAERIADWMEIHGWRGVPQQIRAGEWRTPLKAWTDYVDSQVVISDQDPGDEG